MSEFVFPSLTRPSPGVGGWTCELGPEHKRSLTSCPLVYKNPTYFVFTVYFTYLVASETEPSAGVYIWKKKST